MGRIRILLLLCFLVISPYGICQYDESGPGYQLTMLSNPGLAGAEGNGYLRLSYLNFYPGNNYNLYSVNLSYDGYFPGLHGGAGFFISNDNLGSIINNLRGGFSYAYYFQVGRDLFISAGLSASLYHRGYNFSGALLPDQIDPLGGAVLTSQEMLNGRGKNVLDMATGFLFVSGPFFWGISVNHLTEPDPDYSETPGSKIPRKLLFHFTGDFNINEEHNLKIRPMGKFEVEKGYISAGAGAVLESKSVSVSSIILRNNQKDIDLQTGLSLITGNVTFYYNYRFNIVSGKSLLPVSLLHYAGIALSLNNVDKRKTVKTINFPEL